MSTTADLNDYSSRVNITGVTIASIPIDIVAQTIGNITIDIAAVSAGAIAISINVADIVGNIPIDIVAQTIGNITIDIAAASMGSIAVSINVADIVGNLPIDIVAQTIGNISIDIAAQTVGNIGIDIAANSFGNLPIDIVAQTIGNIGISLNANTAGNITVDIAAQTMVGNLSIDIAANSFGNLPIDIVAQTIGNIGINLAANTLGNLTIDIAAQTLGNIAIDVAAQTVDLNIKTSGGVNIIIDKLTQSAYTARNEEIKNDNNVTTPTAPPNNYTAIAYRGKFFPRGMRGFHIRLSVYCKRTAAGTITLAYSPQPGMGEIDTVTITPGAAWDWKHGALNKFWNYDSLFVWIKTIGADVSYGYDTTQPIDGHDSADSGVTWAAADRRYYIRTFIYSMTVGDIPVSGTINTVDLPSIATRLEETGVMCNTGVYTTIATIHGAGKLLDCSIYFNTVVVPSAIVLYYLRLEVDGVLAHDIGNKRITQSLDAASGRCSIGEFLQANGETMITLHLPFSFKRSLRLIGFQSSGANVTAIGRIIANLIS